MEAARTPCPWGGEAAAPGAILAEQFAGCLSGAVTVRAPGFFVGSCRWRQSIDEPLLPMQAAGVAEVERRDRNDPATAILLRLRPTSTSAVQMSVPLFSVEVAVMTEIAGRVDDMSVVVGSRTWCGLSTIPSAAAGADGRWFWLPTATAIGTSLDLTVIAGGDLNAPRS